MLNICRGGGDVPLRAVRASGCFGLRAVDEIHEAPGGRGALVELRPVTRGELDAYTVELTAIVRRYIEARFRVSAPEMTTEEFLGEVAKGELLAAAPSDLVRDLLRRADLVKFAAYRPTRFEADELLSAAERFVDQTQDLAAAFAAEGAVS